MKMYSTILPGHSPPATPLNSAFTLDDTGMFTCIQNFACLSLLLFYTIIIQTQNTQQGKRGQSFYHSLALMQCSQKYCNTRIDWEPRKYMYQLGPFNRS